MKNKEVKCSCGAGNKVVLSCSGASDVGAISDQVARALAVAGHRKMGCMAKIGAGIEKAIEEFKTKDILVIDGCPVACGRKALDRNNFENYKHMIVTNQGLIKGKSPANDDNVQKVLKGAIEA